MLVITAPAGHVTVATVPKLLPVPHAVDSTDDDREREADRDTVAVTLEPKVCVREFVGETDRERDVDGDGERVTVGVRPAWHCTYRMYVREPPQPDPVAAASCVLGLMLQLFCHRHVALAKAPFVVAASLHVPTANGPLGHEPVGLP